MAPATSPPPAVPSSAATALSAGGVEEIVDRAFVFYRRRFLACLVVMAVVQVPVTFGLTLISETAIRKIEQAGLDAELLSQGFTYAILVFLPSAILSLIAAQIGTGALTYLVGKECLGTRVGVIESYRWAFRRVMPLLGTAAIIGLASVLGFFFFVVPGIIAFLVTFAAVPAVMLENKGVKAGLVRSYELATGSLGRVAAVRLLTALFFAACLAVGYSIAGGLTARPDAQLMLSQIPTLIAGPVDSISMVLLYYDLRVRREGMDLEALAQMLGDGE